MKNVTKVQTISGAFLESEIRKIQDNGGYIRQVLDGSFTIPPGGEKYFHIIYVEKQKPRENDEFNTHYDWKHIRKTYCQNDVDTSDALTYMWSGLRAGKTSEIIHQLRTELNRLNRKIKTEMIPLEKSSSMRRGTFQVRFKDNKPCAVVEGTL